MDQRQYDATPVFPDNNVHDDTRDPSEPDGSLWRTDLEGMAPDSEVRPAVRPLSSSVLIDSRANLLELLDRFCVQHTFLLVVGSMGLDGLVTPSDMKKQAGRTHLLMHVSALELALADRLRGAAQTEAELLRLLPRERASKVRSRLKRQERLDQAADLIATFDFEDLLLIERHIGRADFESLLSPKQISSLSGFRNRIMHSVLSPTGDDPERLNELLSHTKLVERLLDALTTSA